MDTTILLLLLSSSLLHRAIGSACFTQSPWKNVRSLVAIGDPCASIADCETACLADSQCDAYVYSTRCGLFSVESSKPQTCVQSPGTLWQRASICGGAQSSTTVAPSSTTTNAAQTSSTTSGAATTTTTKATTTTVATTTTAGTTTTTKPTTTTTTSAVSPCGTLIYEQSADCAGGCPSPAFALMETTCDTRYTLYVDGNGQGNLTCVGTDWTYVYMGSPYTFAAGSKVYCVRTM